MYSDQNSPAPHYSNFIKKKKKKAQGTQSFIPNIIEQRFQKLHSGAHLLKSPKVHLLKSPISNLNVKGFSQATPIST